MELPHPDLGGHRGGNGPPGRGATYTVLATADPTIPSGSEVGDASLDVVGGDRAMSIDAHQPRRCGRCERPIQPRRDDAVSVHQQLDPGVRGGVRRDNPNGRVFGLAVHHQDLERLVGLRADRFEAGTDEGLLVAADDHHGHQGVHVEILNRPGGRL